MQDGLVKVAAVTPELQVADCQFNKEKLVEKAKEMAGKGVRLVVFPELSLTGATCGDLYLQDTLLFGALTALKEYVDETRELDLVSVVGMPMEQDGILYDVAVVVNHGEIKGIVPKCYLSARQERQFSSGLQKKGNVDSISWQEKEVPFGAGLIFACDGLQKFTFGVEIGDDLLAPIPPSSGLALNGAMLIVNLAASPTLTGNASYRLDMVKSQSARTLTAYVYAEAGEGESTTDVVFGGHNIIAEKGIIVAENEPFAKEKDLVTEIDLGRIYGERRRSVDGLFAQTAECQKVLFQVATDKETKLTRRIEKMPFVPSDPSTKEVCCDEILNIQSHGLAKRMKHTCCKNAIIGLSGGLDSTLALLVTVRAFEQLGIDCAGIVAVTMPCFGTTNRTYDNAVNLAKECGATLKEIPIRDAITQHFEDIGQDMDNHDVTYENAQARERTQVLMDVANQVNGMVIGTGDLSELALGWATYNGDHMSMYGVNASVPKTLVRHLVQYCADTTANVKLKEVLYDVLDTPVSPELLPLKDGEVSQKTEDIVGPYELHDFFLYYVLRCGFSPKKIFRLAVYAFEGEYDRETIYHWLSTFCHRFFRQQFKRSCLPDGPKVGTISVSPRGDLQMPSDATDTLWKKELDGIRQSLV